MRVAVLGAGAGGLAATVELTRAGHEVSLWNRNPVRLGPYMATAGIPVRGVWGKLTMKPHSMTSDLRHALASAEAVVICLPSVAHPELFADLAHAPCSVPIVLNPGHTGGALHIRHVFGLAGVPLPPVVEFSTLTYISRVDPDGTVNVTARAGVVHAGALPRSHEALEYAQVLFPGAIATPDVLASSLSNINLVLHPPGAVLGAAWVEATGGDFTFYVDGITPGVARVIEQLDAERLEVAEAFGHDLPSLLDEMAGVGTIDLDAAQRGDTRAAIRGGTANSAIKAPDSLAHRYFREDFAFGLLPFTALAAVAAVEVPTAAALLQIGCVLTGWDFEANGLSADRMGVTGLNRDSLIEMVTGEGVTRP